MTLFWIYDWVVMLLFWIYDSVVMTLFWIYDRVVMMLFWIYDRVVVMLFHTQCTVLYVVHVLHTCCESKGSARSKNKKTLLAVPYPCNCNADKLTGKKSLSAKASHRNFLVVVLVLWQWWWWWCCWCGRSVSLTSPSLYLNQFNPRARQIPTQPWWEGLLKEALQQHMVHIFAFPLRRSLSMHVPRLVAWVLPCLALADWVEQCYTDGSITHGTGSLARCHRSR